MKVPEKDRSPRGGRQWLRLLIVKDFTPGSSPQDDRRLEKLRWSVFIALHLVCFAALWTGISPTALLVALGLYLARMFFIGGFYHRYFSHKTFKASRGVQFAMAAAGCTAGQRGPLWWAGHHRYHHAHTERPEDPHSPRQRGLFVAHMGWFMKAENWPTPARYVRDWARFRELRWIDRYDFLPFFALAALAWGTGALLARFAPQLHTNGAQMLVVGFFWSTIALYHGTYTINSLAHLWGRRSYATRDDSRNNGLLALLTLGEGWHNNHHFYPGAARQGVRWWELDITYWGLRLCAGLGLIRRLRPVPERVFAAAKRTPDRAC
ncbi:MAG: acyl-CoA desaturase [Gammaproteobacteria bacterium]